MGKVVNFKDITNWVEIFDMTYEYLSFLLEVKRITSKLIIKIPYDILKNAGYSYTLEEVRKQYYHTIG